MGLSIEEQRERIRKQRNPKRFHKVKHLKVDVNKVKGGKYKDRIKKINDVRLLIEELYGKKKRKSKKKTKRSKKEVSDFKKLYLEYLKSDEWIQIRIDLYEQRGYKCERCSNTKSIQVHHKHYDNLFNEEPKDLELLCARCHMDEHGIR